MNPSTRHVVILGAGAVGLTLATFLRNAGQRVTLVARRADAVSLPLTIEDGIHADTRTLGAVETCHVDAMPPEPDHLIVCTRGDQLKSALNALNGRVAAHVPITVAAATFEDLRRLADQVAIANPILRMGIGFGAWRVGPARLRLFSLGRQGSAIACEQAAQHAAARDDLASLLQAAGLPCRAAPTAPFRWLFRTILALEVPFLHAYRKADWDLDQLVATPELLALCAEGMHEAARAMRAEAGPIALAASLAPRAMLLRMARRRALRASHDFREIWRHHGPKTETQLRYLTAQLNQRAATPALDALAAS